MIRIKQNRSRFLEDAKRYDDSSCLIAFKMIDAATTTPIELNTLEKEVLVHMITELGTRYQIADAERLQLKRLMNDVKSIRIQFAELFIRHEELQSAHLMQSKVIQKLQKNQRKVDVYSETIKTQENIILKLETIIKFQSSAGTPNTDESKFIDMNTSDTLVMTSEVKKLIDQINKLELEISSLKNMQKKSIDNICNNDGEIIDSNTSNRFQLYEIELLKLEESATHNQRVLSQLHSENYRLKESVTEMEAALQVIYDVFEIADLYVLP